MATRNKHRGWNIVKRLRARNLSRYVVLKPSSSPSENRSDLTVITLSTEGSDNSEQSICSDDTSSLNANSPSNTEIHSVENEGKAATDPPSEFKQEASANLEIVTKDLNDQLIGHSSVSVDKEISEIKPAAKHTVQAQQQRVVTACENKVLGETLPINIDVPDLETASSYSLLHQTSQDESQEMPKGISTKSRTHTCTEEHSTHSEVEIYHASDKESNSDGIFGFLFSWCSPRKERNLNESVSTGVALFGCPMADVEDTYSCSTALGGCAYADEESSLGTFDSNPSFDSDLSSQSERSLHLIFGPE